MNTHIRKNITLPRTLDDELRREAERRHTTQSSLIAHLVRVGLAEESPDPLMRYIGCLDGPTDMSSTVDEVVYGRERPR